MESGIQLMFDLSPLTTYPEQTVGASAHPVKTSPSQDSEKDLTETEVPSFEKYFGFLGNSKKKIDLNGLSTKMLRECYQATVGHLRSRGRKQIFPLKGADGEDSVEVVQIGQRNRPGRDNLNQYRTYSPDGVAPCLNKMDGGGREPHIPVQFGIDYNVSGEETEIANCLKARYDAGVSNFKHDRTAVAIPVLTPDRAEKRQNGRRFKDNGDESFTLTAQDRHGVALAVDCYDAYNKKWIGMESTGCLTSNSGGSTTHSGTFEMAIKVKEATKQGYAIAHEGDSINLSMPESKTRRGRVGNQVAQTLDCGCNQGIFVKLNESTTVYAVWHEKYNCYIAIRKLTPLECFRLQGWTDDYFEKAAFVNSDSQLYKQAGNGVTVDVVQAIAEKLKESETE